MVYEEENSYEDSDEYGLSASTVKRFLKDHPEFLEIQIMHDVELQQRLERWMIRRSQSARQSLGRNGRTSRENSYEDSDEYGLSASTVKRFLKNHPEFLETHIMHDVELQQQLERWMIRRSQSARQSLGRNGRTSRENSYEDSDEYGLSASTVKRFLKNHPDFLEIHMMQDVELEQQLECKSRLSRSKFGVHADKRQLLQDLTQSLQLQPTKAHILFELASCISSAVNADGFTVYIAESCDPENMSVYKGQSTSGNNEMQKVKLQEGSYLLHVAKTREAVRLSKGVPDARFPDGIPENSEIGYVLCQAIAQPDGQLIAVVELFRREECFPFHEKDEEIFCSYLVWGGIALHYAHLLMNTSQHRQLHEFLLTVVKSIFQDMVSMDMLVTKIMNFAQRLVDADRASLFLVDEKRKELFAYVFDVGNRQPPEDTPTILDEIRFPIGTGIAGIVALTGEILNIQDVYSDPRFNRLVDQKTGYKTQTILCMPIFIQGTIIGVVEMVNKFSGYFTKEDEQAFEIFAVYCGLALHNARLYDKIRQSEHKYKVALEVLSYHNTSTDEEVEKFLTDPNLDIAPDIDDYYFNPFDFDDMQKIRLSAHMFIDLFGLKRFNKNKLIKFTLTIKKNYRRVPYHNWNHGFSVANIIYSLVKKTSDVFQPIECLALYIGSLCHDLDHRGKNNKFMLDTESPLAAVYSTSTMENHHFNQTVEILQQKGHNIFSKLSGSEYKQVLDLIKHCILATDLAQFFPNKTKLQNLIEEETFTWSKHEHRLLVQAIAMTSSDLSASAKPWEVQEKTVKVIFEEFYDQGDAERKTGLTPIPMMDRNKPEEQANSQVSFLSGICIPCYSLLYRLIPESKPLLDMCQRNLDRWKEIAQDEGEKQMKRSSVEEGPDGVV